MGIDILDMSFRIEKEFGIRLSADQFTKIAIPRENEFWDLCAGDLHNLICRELRARSKPVPFSSWNRVRLLLARVGSIDPRMITRESRLYRDLGFS